MELVCISKPAKYIWVNFQKGRPKQYYYFGTYKTWDDALETAKYLKSVSKAIYHIRIDEEEGLIPVIKFHVYVNMNLKPFM